MLAHQQAQAAASASDLVFLPLHDRCRAEIDALPPKELPADPYLGRGSGVTTANRHVVSIARRRVEDWDAGKAHVEDYIRKEFEAHIADCRAVVMADEERKAEIAAIQQRHGYGPAEERWEALTDAAVEAEWALMDMPAPDTDALLWKLEKLLEADESGTDCWSAEAVAQTVSDMRCLLARGA
jgi:hypothetical protein